jgi:hypothetical protein
MESVNQALSKTPTTIRLDHLTPLLEVIARMGDFAPASICMAAERRKNGNAKAFGRSVNGPRVDDIFKKGGPGF